MTDREINVAIAEACGWKKTQKEGWGFSAPMMFPAHEKDGNTVFDSELPNYCADLNAMREALITLTDEKISMWYYILTCEVLPATYTDKDCVTSTARQRAEAFLRTIGKWVE